MSYTPYIAPTPSNATWTYVTLGTNFTMTSNTAQDITGLAFTPAANTKYEVECVFLTRTATTTVGPRPGCAWPTGLTDGVAWIQITSGATSNVLANGNINASVIAPVGGLPGTTASYPSVLHAVFQAGATPSGTFKAQVASETNGTTVTVVAGSFLRYRTY